MAFGGRARPALLEGGVLRESVAAECRRAALEFMAGVASGWTKLDLAQWLTGVYAHATRHCQHGERTFIASASASVDSTSIEELLSNTRGPMLSALQKAALSDGSLDFADEAIDRGFVRRAVDADGMEVWIPVDGARMCLRDRVQALFVADFLNDPIAFGTLYVCRHCEAIVFDQAGCTVEMCLMQRRRSAIVTRNAETDEEAALPAVGATDLRSTTHRRRLP